MSDSSNDELETLVRDWAAKQAAPAGKLDELARRISELLNESHESDKVVVSPRISSRRMLRWTAALGATAASIALLFTIVRSFDPSEPGTKRALKADRGESDTGGSVFIGDLELAEKAQLARELQHEFPGHFAWLMESREEMTLGLSDDEITRPSQWIAVRLVIESQGPDEREWKPVRAFDVIALSEETVQTTLASNHRASIAIWAYAMADGMITVDSELTLSGPVPVRVSSSRLLSSGARTVIWHSERDGVKYRIHQAAELLDSEQLG